MPCGYKQGPEAVFQRVLVRPDDCWLWQGHTNNDGYGVLGVGGKLMKAHRAAFLVEHGYLPKVVQHSCDTPACCNPDHLVAGTVQTNHADMVQKCRHGRTKLTPQDVEFIRSSNDLGINLAKQFGVQPSCISRIRNRKRLASVTCIIIPISLS